MNLLTCNTCSMHTSNKWQFPKYIIGLKITTVNSILNPICNHYSSSASRICILPVIQHNKTNYSIKIKQMYLYMAHNIIYLHLTRLIRLMDKKAIGMNMSFLRWCWYVDKGTYYFAPADKENTLWLASASGRPPVANASATENVIWKNARSMQTSASGPP